MKITIDQVTAWRAIYEALADEALSDGRMLGAALAAYRVGVEYARAVELGEEVTS